MRRVAQLISVRSRCRGQQKKEMHKARLGSHTRGDRETARNAGSRRSRQRERRSRSQGNTERFAIAQEQRQRLAAYDGRATGAVSGSRPKPAPTLARASLPAQRSPNQQRRTAERAPLQELGQRPPFEEIEEVRSVVGRRRDVKLIVPKEFFALWPKQRDGAIEEIILIENIESVCLLTRHSREKAEVKGALFGEASDCCRVFAGQRTVLNQKRGGVPASYERQVATRLADPSALQR